jgi:hypothetical protein
MTTYAAVVRLAGAGQQHVLIRADNAATAKAMLEAQFGKGCVSNLHTATTTDLKRAGR